MSLSKLVFNFSMKIIILTLSFKYKQLRHGHSEPFSIQYQDIFKTTVNF